MSSHVEEEHALKITHGDQFGGKSRGRVEILTEEEGDEADKAITRPQWSAIIVTS